jgi:hypothetical protein
LVYGTGASCSCRATKTLLWVCRQRCRSGSVSCPGLRPLSGLRSRRTARGRLHRRPRLRAAPSRRPRSGERHLGLPTPRARAAAPDGLNGGCRRAPRQRIGATPGPTACLVERKVDRRAGKTQAGTEHSWRSRVPGVSVVAVVVAVDIVRGRAPRSALVKTGTSNHLRNESERPRTRS